VITGASALAAGPLLSPEVVLKAARADAAEEAQTEYDDETKPAKEDSEVTDSNEDTDKDESSSAEVLPESVATFGDANLALRFERIRDLVLVGFEDGARRELREIEMRVRTLEDRKLLITEFVNVKNFERASYMAEVGFAPARLQGGVLGPGRAFWEYAYPRAWESAVVQASKATAVPEELIWGIMRAESHFRSEARSPVGALGLMQMMPFTGRKVADLLNLKSFDTRTLIEPETNIKLGSRYLQRLVEKFSGKVPLVAGAYNAGPHRVHAWVRNFGSLDMDEFIEHIPFNETRNYVKRVSRNFQIYRLLYGASGTPAPTVAIAGVGGGDNSTSPLQAMRWIIQPVGVQLSEPHSIREVW
jgi:soluble lytic murein transglycosylase